MAHRIIPDDEIKYVPKEKLDKLRQEVSAATEFSVVKTGHKKEQKEDIVDQIAESEQDDEDNISDEEFGDLTAQIKAKVAKENPELVKAAEAEKKAKTKTKTKTVEEAMKELKEVKKPSTSGVFGAVKLR